MALKKRPTPAATRKRVEAELSANNGLPDFEPPPPTADFDEWFDACSLTLRELIAECEYDNEYPVYVVNRALEADDTFSTQGKFILSVGLTNQAGQVVSTSAIIVDQTFVPVCLTDQASWEDLVNDHQFRRMVNEGYLVPVRECFVNWLYSDKNSDRAVYIRERDRLIEDYKARRTGSIPSYLTKEEEGQKDSLKKEVSSGVINIIESNADLTGKRVALSKLKLTIKDLEYIQKSIPDDDANSTQMHRWVLTKMKEINKKG